MKTVIRNTPEWATNLVIQVCHDYKRALPQQLQWYKTTGTHTSGRTHYKWPGLRAPSKIHVSAGTDEWEHRVVLLHELAHHILGKTKKGKQAGHNLQFWRLLFELASNYGDVTALYKRDIDLARGWRPGTRKMALVAYDELPNKK